LLDSSTVLSFFGHTHHQGGFLIIKATLKFCRFGRDRWSHFRAASGTGPQIFAESGSIGQPRDGDPRAAFAIADFGHNIVEFWRVPYDIPSVQSRMYEANLPEPLIHRLSLGR